MGRRALLGPRRHGRTRSAPQRRWQVKVSAPAVQKSAAGGVENSFRQLRVLMRRNGSLESKTHALHAPLSSEEAHPGFDPQRYPRRVWRSPRDRRGNACSKLQIHSPKPCWMMSPHSLPGRADSSWAAHSLGESKSMQPRCRVAGRVGRENGACAGAAAQLLKAEHVPILHETSWTEHAKGQAEKRMWLSI